MSKFTCKVTDTLDTLSNNTFCGHLKAFKYLSYTPNNLSRKESIENENYYLAHNAAATGNLNLLKWTFKNTKCKVTDQDDEGLTVLHVACITSKLNIVEWILKHTHLSPVTRTEEGSTALHFSCWSGNLEITKLLVETEPRLINMRMLNGATAAMFATQGGFVDIMEFILNEGANFGLPTTSGVNCLHMAAQQGHLDAVKWLIEHTGLRLNGKDDNGITPIHYAAVHNHHDIVSWLLEKEVRLLKERFVVDFEKSVSIDDSRKSIEEIINAQNNLSVRNICEFSELESVQEKVTAILSQFNNTSLVNKTENEINTLVECSIPIDVILLLQSALVDLRSQYQKIIRQSYLSMKTSAIDKISEETQTIEFYESSEDYKRHIIKSNSSRKEIPRPSISDHSGHFQNENLISPPPPPLPLMSPPQFNPNQSDSPTISTTIDSHKNKMERKFNRHRRGSSSDDIKLSLIQELKMINMLRTKNNQDDTESTTSNTDSSSLNDSNSLCAKYRTRNYIADSAPNLTSIFQFNGNSGSNVPLPKWKIDLATKQISNTEKDEDSLRLSNEMPSWKRQLIENKGISPVKNINRHSESSNLSTIVNDDSQSPKISKVTQLVNQWQNNST